LPGRTGILLHGSFLQHSFATDLDGNLVWFYPETVTFLTEPRPGGLFLGIVQRFQRNSSYQVLREFDLAGMTTRETNAERISEQLGKNLGRWREASRQMREATLKHLWDDGRGVFLKSIDPLDRTIDASTLLAIKLGIVDSTDKRAERLVQEVESRLWNKEVGGLARYEGDQYYGRENPWIISTLWLAEAHLILGRPDRCRELIEWSAKTASPTLLLPEQVDARTGHHTSVTPLVWSHSTFLDVVNKYQRYKEGLSEDRHD